MRRLGIVLAGAALLGGSAVAAAQQPSAPVATIKAGYGQADATWHVGAAAGQYAPENTGLAEGLAAELEEGDVEGAAGYVADEAEVDPHAHSRAKEASYGTHSRLTARAIVVEGVDGRRVALLKTDNYLAQDLLLRRVGQLLDEGDSGVGYDDVLHAATHNHSSPYYTTTSPGVFVFQDVVDHRMLEYQARAVRDAIEAAARDLRPARMAATTVSHSLFKANVVGEAVADDGSPAGYPREFGDTGVVVMRFDELVDKKGKGKGEGQDQPRSGGPIATWVNFGQHPESLDGYGLTTADFLGPLERFVQRDTGAPLVFSQGDVGSAEGPYDRADTNTTPTPDGTVRAYAHAGYAQMERGARLLADAVVEGFELAATDAAQVPWSSSFPVALQTAWVPGPLSHPYPSVGNCRSEPTVQGDPGVGVAPDCERAGTPPVAAEALSIHGLPVPAHYGAPGYPAVEENTRLKLQVVRLGEVLLASCACEAQVDLILNLETRANTAQGDMHLGYLWQCTPAGAEWRCPQRDRTLTVSDAAYQRMRAQVLNDAAGWDDPAYVAQAEAEPADPADIKGNFTHEELPPSLGYALPVGIGHAGDYNGYTVSYREYMSRDSYRKALTSYGPHTADYMVTRLVRMAAGLKSGTPFALDPADEARAAADEARQVALAESVGRASAAAYDAWQASLSDDLGPVEALVQPASVQRFSAATFTWRGGSNAVDNPVVSVERLVDGAWREFADASGEVQTRVAFPRGAQGVADAHTGAHSWVWTASFEAFDAFPARIGSTPAGTYRFVVDGASRSGGATVPYALTSAPFTVSPWAGVAVTAPAVADGVASFTASATYPRTYASSFRTIADDGGTRFCRTCTFRPWATTGEVVSVVVTVTSADGSVREVPATRAGSRWSVPLAPGETAEVRPGAARDAFGNTNGVGLALTS